MYLFFKLMHLFAVVIFLGNIITGLFWKVHGDRTKDPRVMAAVIDGIIRSDRLFTVPGVLVIIAGGVAAAMVGGYPLLGTRWIFWSLILFSVAGVAFMAFVAPLQRKLLAVARAGVESNTLDWDEYHRLSRRWELWGAVALLTPLAAFALMIFKPAG